VDIGGTRLFSNVWKILSYANLVKADENFETVKTYGKVTTEFYQRHECSEWVNLTKCRSLIKQV